MNIFQFGRGNMTILFIVLSLTALVASTNAAATKPNIVFVLVDDWGFADVSFRNPAIHSPNFQKLADNGVILNRHYVYRYCSPTRIAFLSGRWPHHAHQYNIEPPFMIGANINMTLLPAKLKTAGYSTHIVGKWHEGFYQTKYLPINRGFDTSSGFLAGAEDHFTQVRECAVDFWKDNQYDTRNGSYDAYTYCNDLTAIFKKHDTTKPMFLYLPLHNVHGPFQAPDDWLNLYAINSTCSQRRTIQAMVSVADNVTGHAVELLKKYEMWDNTIFIVSADNGGAACAGSNHPLKGSKGTYFEGGVRALAFASGGLIPPKMIGKSVEGFIHVADWYPTFCKLAGVDPDDSGTGKFPVDGMDVWPMVTGEREKTLHDEIVLGYNFSNSGAIIAGDYKLIVNKQGERCDNLMWSPLDYPCSDGPKGGNCDPYCLYDIVNDPRETKDLSTERKDVLEDLLKRYNKYSKEPRDMQDQGYHSASEVPTDKNACQYMKEHGGYWQPWKDEI
jgi:arylsulfatase A-like enzyme